MKAKVITNKEALIKALVTELRPIAQDAIVCDGPYYLVTSKHNVAISSQIEKAVKNLPQDHQLVIAANNVTEEASAIVSENAGVLIVKSNFYWTDEQALKNAR